MRYIRNLADERASLFPEGVDAFMAVIQGKRLTSTGASGLIDRLAGLPKDTVAAAPVAPGQPARDPSRRSNAYPGQCINCKRTVAAGEGYLAGSRQTGWKAEHIVCPPADEPEAPRKHEISEIVGDLEDGWYGVPTYTEGESDTIFVQIYTNKGIYHPERKGQRGVKLIAGGGNEHVMSTALITKVVATIRAMGVIESMKMYSTNMGMCGYCHKDLSVTLSKVTGFGPKCRAHLGYVVSDEERAEAARIIAEAKARGEELV